ncbi:hypothetical protein [Amycolatopsis sp. NPDC059657]|uniref:hypothetical protein n=1 Tax=Amycolatopsis sp. NPDC059657 TaxID=3346899 RepID=UPI0036713498
MTGTRTVFVALTAFAGLTVLSACGAGVATVAIDTAQSSDAKGLVATQVGTLGNVVTAPDGRTLYRFDKDRADPPVSTCNDNCAAQWPPLIAEGSTVSATGVDPALLGTVTRKDGRKQVTIKGYPVYRFAKDTKPGEAKGHGMGGMWFAVTPDGAKAGRG